MEFHVLKIRAVWGTRFLHLFFATSDLERNIRFHFASDCFATKIVKEKKYFCVVGGTQLLPSPTEHFAVLF